MVTMSLVITLNPLVLQSLSITVLLSIKTKRLVLFVTLLIILKPMELATLLTLFQDVPSMILKPHVLNVTINFS